MHQCLQTEGPLVAAVCKGGRAMTALEVAAAVMQYPRATAARAWVAVLSLQAAAAAAAQLQGKVPA